MKKIVKKLKGKKVLSVVLAALMLATTFNIALPMLKLDANAVSSITTSDGTAETITQERVVTDYETVYDNYAIEYLDGAGEATNIVIPGLPEAQDYVIQGMTYYPQRDWMLITAYHNYDSENDAAQRSSKVFCMDASTGNFYAMLSFLNVDGTTNVDHGGGIAISENNLYYSCGDTDRSIAYAPLSALDGITEGEHRVVKLVDEIEFYETGSVTSDSKTAYTAYVCYDDGILWTGNFYDPGTDILGMGSIAADYNAPATSQYNSVVYGYNLEGSSSTEEWNYLKGIYKNLITVTATSGTGTANGANHIWAASQHGESIGIIGSITAPTAYTGEFTGNFASATLTEGTTYKIEFTSSNNASDMYIFSPTGTHCNVKQSSATTITDNGDGTYHYSMTFTAGLKPASADSTWPTTQSADGSYTGTYTIRFDQDAIQAGEARDYAITDVRISVAKDGSYSSDAGYRGTPSHAIALDNNIKDVQYAVVDDGKLYLSRSYGSGAGNSVNFGFGETSFLTVADIDLSAIPAKDLTISTSSDNSTTKTIKAHVISEYENFTMMPMSEGLCVINDLIFVTFEGASNKYLNESSGLTSIGNCEKPVDVVWKIDPYALEEEVKTEDDNALYYEKVNSLSEIKDGEEYLIVYESPVEDPVTQQNILYAIDANGGYKNYKLSKRSQDNTNGYAGMIGHEITEYSIVDNKLYLDNAAKDDVRNIRWELTNLTATPTDGSDAFSIQNTEHYFFTYPNFYCDASSISMATDNVRGTSMKIYESNNGNGGFWICNNDTYYLWCNDGTTPSYDSAINNYYVNSGVTMYAGIAEQPGTFHTDALNLSGSNILGGAVVTGADSYYSHGIFYIYKRVVDSVASTYESRVYTDLNAELQADGTYTIDLSTYAISPNHYQYVGERPTDYIIVMDTSKSVVDGADGTGIIEYSSTNQLLVSSLCDEADTKTPSSTTGVHGYAFSRADEQIFIKHSADGKYYKVYLAIYTYSVNLLKNPNRQFYWAYYIADDGLYYMLSDSGVASTGITKEQFYQNVDNAATDYDNGTTTYSDYTTKTGNGDRRKESVYTGVHYRFAPASNEQTPLSTIKEKAVEIVDQIAATGADNRIALVQYGGSTAYLGTSGWATTGYTDALWEANSSNVTTLKTQITNIDSTQDSGGSGEQTDNTGMELSIANSIIDNSGFDYTADGTRNTAIIFMSDGVPGSYDGGSITTAANNVIQKSLEAKNKGAFVYSVIVGADNDSWNKRLFMDAVSSKYPAAESLTNLGGENIDGVEYVHNLTNCSLYGYLDFSAIVGKEIVKNNAVGLANLDASAILCEELSDAFIISVDEEGNLTDDVTMTCSLVPGDFDAVERFTFRENEAVTENTGLTVGWDSTSPNKLTVTGYDYSSEYLAKGKTGRKLQIRITGVLANPDADITNTSISNTATTAIYQTSSDMTSGNAFKYLPTVYFNIPEYTYVLDYGLQLLDTDVNGTLKAVSAGLTKQDVNNYIRESENGLVAIADNNLDLLYHTTPTNKTDSGYVLIQRDNGKYDWFEIKVVPASNVYFEETEFATDAGTGTVAWSTATSGTSSTYRGLPEDGDVDGYDKAYDNTNTYSNGTTLSATVDSSNKRSKTATVSFAGNGIDIVSACGPTTGMQIINIKDASTGKSVAASIVDTYYADSTFTQVPVFSWRGNYGNYTVETTAVYLTTAGALQKSSFKNSLVDTGLVMNSSDNLNTANIEAMLDAAGVEDIDAENLELVWFDDNSVLNGGTGVAPTKKGARAGETTSVTLNNYIDGFRIYNPLGSDSSYYAETEQGAVYYNVIDSLVDGTLSDGSLDFESGTVAFVTGSLADGEFLSFSNYESIGPKNELYLQGGTETTTEGVTFKTPVADGGRVMISLRAVNGATTVSINGSDPISVTSATEMYYDITGLLDAEEVAAGSANVTIINKGSGILAVNNIKLTKASATTGLMLLGMDDLETAQYYATMEPVEVTVENGVVTPVVEEDNTEEDTTTDNNDTTTESGESEEFSIFSLIEILMAFIENILRGAFGSGKLF